MSKIRYDEIFNSRRIIKIRLVDKSDDFESVYFVPDIELDEDITRVGFGLDQVQGWEEYHDPFNKFLNKESKIVVQVYGYEYLILLEDWEDFNSVMREFMITQRIYDSNTEKFITEPS